MSRRAGLALAASAATLLLLAGADRLLGVVVPTSWLARSLVFPPNVKFEMITTEFHVEVRTNEMGFRGAPLRARSPGRPRIVAIGDSFTYGWGVEVEEAWPARLEGYLNVEGRGFEADVLNLGSPGAGPNEYAETAERALPMLKPDLVLVGMLLGDDLLQSGNVGAGPVSTYRGPTFSQVASRVFPTLLGLYSSVRERSRRAGADAEILTSMSRSFRDGAADARRSFTPEQAQRYEQLGPNVREMFEAGEVNPALVSLAVQRPGYFLEPVESDDATLAPYAEGMVRALRRIRRAAESVGAQVLVVCIPYPFYVSDRAQARLSRLGFRTDASALTSPRPGRMLADGVRAAGLDDAGVEYPVEELRKGDRSDGLYFAWDNHFTRDGHQVFAALLTPIVLERLAHGPGDPAPAADPVR